MMAIAPPLDTDDSRMKGQARFVTPTPTHPSRAKNEGELEESCDAPG